MKPWEPPNLAQVFPVSLRNLNTKVYKLCVCEINCPSSPLACKTFMQKPYLSYLIHNRLFVNLIFACHTILP
jgi:hypothetical protein